MTAMTEALVIQESISSTSSEPLQATPDSGVAQSFVDEDAAEQASALAIPEVLEVEEIPVSLLAGDAAERGSLPPVQGGPLFEEVPQSLLGPHAEEDPSQASFLSFFGLSEQPFCVTADLSYLCFGQEHREAWTSLADDAAEQANPLAILQAPEVEEMPVPILPEDAVEQASVPAIPEVPEVEEIPVSFLSDITGEQASMPPIQTSPILEEVPQSLPAPHAEEEPSQPTLLSFFGLREQPFGITPDPSYLYFGQERREALKSLLTGIQNDRGFMALIAEPGMGKTTLLNKLMEELRDSARTVFLFQTQCSSRELFRYLLSELGVANAGMDLVAMHNKLNEILFQEMLEGRRFVLIVDEAQNLHESVLETIRLLSDFETSHAKLVQIVLAGQPQLAAKLARPGLSQLRQRIATLTKLQPLSPAETARYIEHRLRVASTSGELPFSPDALALIAELSQGTPRSINNICFNALMLGYAKGRKVIDSEIVHEVVSELDLEPLVRRPQPKTPEPAPVAAADNLQQLACPPLAALPAQSQPEQPCSNAARASVKLSGKLSELIPSGHWSGKKREFRIQASLERDPSCRVPVVERYYCCSFYVGEDEATALRPGQPIRITIEQD